VLQALEPVVDRLIVTKSDSPRALAVSELFEEAVRVFGADRVFKEEDLNSAITYAMEQVTLINQVSEGVSAVVVTGSVVTAGSARVILRKIGRSEEK
jgi:dihydrofolate synthase/folylpolyglutamate synthase